MHTTLAALKKEVAEFREKLEKSAADRLGKLDKKAKKDDLSPADISSLIGIVRDLTLCGDVDGAGARLSQAVKSVKTRVDPDLIFEVNMAAADFYLHSCIFAQALGLYEKCSLEAGGAGTRLARALRGKGKVLWLQGRMSGAQEAFTLAMTEALASNDTVLLCDIYLDMGTLLEALDKDSESEESTRLASELVRKNSVNDPALLSRIDLISGSGSMRAGEYEEAERSHLAGIEKALGGDGDGGFSTLPWNLIGAGLCRGIKGNGKEGEGLVRLGLSMFSDRRDPLGTGISNHYLALLSDLKGDIDGAEKGFAATRDIFEKTGLPYFHASCLFDMARMYIDSERLEMGSPLIKRAADIFASVECGEKVQTMEMYLRKRFGSGTKENAPEN